MLFSASVSAQEADSLYIKALEHAMADSVITPEERSLLELIKTRTVHPDQTERAPQASAAQQAQQRSPSTTPEQHSRWLALYRNMLLGNALYGWALPYVLGVEEPRVYAGTEFLAGGLGFYWGFLRKPKQPYTSSQFYMEMTGLQFSLNSIFPLKSLVGRDNWERFDPERKVLLTYMMIATPLGIKWGQRAYNSLRPSDGQSILLASLPLWGSLNGSLLHDIIFSPERVEGEDGEETLAERSNSLFWYGSGVWAYYSLHHKMLNHSFTKGDAYLFWGAFFEAAYVAFQLNQILGFAATGWDEEGLPTGGNPNGERIVNLLVTNGFIYYAYKVASRYDLSTSQAAITSLGGMAGLSMWLGIGYFAGVDFDTPTARALKIISSLGGWYWALQKQIAESQSRHASGLNHGNSKVSSLKVSFAPMVSPAPSGWHWGALLNINF